MNLEYKLNENNNSFIELQIVIEKNIVTNLYFIILMQYDYFISFLITILSDLNIKYNINDLDFPIFNKNNLKDNFNLKLYYKQLENENIIFSGYKQLQNLKYINIYELENNLIFQTNNIEELNNFKNLLEINHKKYLLKLFKCIFDKLFLKIINSENNYIIKKTYKPLLFILKEI
jgi:hypothetical protein